MDIRQNRDGETGVVPFRSGRFFVVSNNWYFTTREGIDKGPYNSRTAANVALDEFVGHCKKLNAIFH